MKIQRDPRPAGNAPLILALVGAAIMIGINIKANAAELELYTSHGYQEEHAAMRPGMTYWPDEIVFELNQTDAPMDASAIVQRAAWSWSQRTGKTITFLGTTASPGAARSGRVTFVWKTLAQIRYITANATTAAATNRWSYTDTGHIAGAIVYLPIDRPQCMDHIAMHEGGHAIGITGHDGTQPTDVMHATQVHCLAALSPHDVSMAPYTDHACHAELMPDGSLFIPAVEGWSAHLVNHNGLLVVARAAPTGLKCPDARLTGSTLLLSDIRSPAGRWMGELRQDGDVWRVVWVAP